MVLKALQNGLHGGLGCAEVGHDHGGHLGGVRVSVGQEFVLEVAGHSRLCRLQAGLQIRELSRHVQQLRGARETEGGVLFI